MVLSKRYKRYTFLVSLLRYTIMLCLVCCFSGATAQEERNEPEEILVSLNVVGIGGTEIAAVLNGEEVYLPIVDLFDFLKIKNEVSVTLDSVSGFYINVDDKYLIDRKNGIIKLGDKSYNVPPEDFFKTETALYLKLRYFDEVFKLEGKFNYRALLVNIYTRLELPAIREARLQFMRSNISRLQGELIADTVLPRRYPAFQLGAAEWSVINNQQALKSGKLNNATRIGIGLGGTLFGGELLAFTNHAIGAEFDRRRQFYSWRFVNNDIKAVRQVTAGKLQTQTISSIFAPIVGVQLTNAPTIIRRAFGTYTIREITEPGWTVELYINNVLVNYTQADAAGFFTFQVPLVYGSSIVKLRFYGPFGEERASERTVNIPFTILPQGVFEYNASAGVIEDDSSSKFTRAIANYGLSKSITLGSGVEYLHFNKLGAQTIPFVVGTARIGGNMLVSAEHDYNVRTRTALSYGFPASFQFNLTYIKYQPGQKVINTGSIEERRASLSIPVRMKKLSIFSLMSLTQNILPNTGYLNAEWQLSGMVYGVGVNLSTNGIFIDEIKPYIYTNAALAFRLPRSLIFTPQVQYEYINKEFISFRGLVEKRFLKIGYLGLSYERNLKSNINNFGIQTRLDLPYAQVGATAFHSNQSTIMLQSARGSLLFDAPAGYAAFRGSVSAGRGAIVIKPFLDMNCNGKRDPGEYKVHGLRVRAFGGTVLREGKDTTIRIVDMEPYTKAYVELNKFSFDNIAWQINKQTISVLVEPNRFVSIEVPVAVVAEISGYVYLQRDTVQKGQGQIYVNIYQGDNLITRILTEPDGYFSYIGLAPGNYRAMIDPVQMHKINMVASPPFDFNVLENEDGDVIDNVEFIIKPSSERK
jgi:hypothetical protein